MILQLNNWRTVRELEIEIPENKTTVLYGANFSGKSNIMLGIQQVLTGACYFIEKGRKATPKQLIRHGENWTRVKLIAPTFESLYEHNNGKITHEVKINGQRVDSDKPEQHLAELLKHIGMDKFADVPAAVKRFLYVNPQSLNIFTIGDAERKAYLLERWDFSKLKSESIAATKKANSISSEIGFLEKLEIEGAETDTKFLVDQITVLEELLKDSVHYSRTLHIEETLRLAKQKEQETIAKSHTLEDEFVQEQLPLLTRIKELEVQQHEGLLDRKDCKEGLRDADFSIKLLTMEIGGFENQLKKPIQCKKCYAEHYYVNEDIRLFDRNSVESTLAHKKVALRNLQNDLQDFRQHKAGWQLKDELTSQQKTLVALKKTQELHRKNYAERLIQLRETIEQLNGDLNDAKASEAKFKELEEYERQLAIAESANATIKKTREQKARLVGLRQSLEGLEFLVKKGLPNIVHECVEQPLINLIAEINHGLEAMNLEEVELDSKVAYELTRNGDGLPSDIVLSILTHGRRETFTSINSQGLARILSFVSLIGEFAAFGSPFKNLEGLVLFDDPLFGAFDFEELDIKSRLARAIGKLSGGTRLIAIGDEAAVQQMNPDVVYRVWIENDETKVARI